MSILLGDVMAADRIVVPDGDPNLQAYLDAASPGDIVYATGTYAPPIHVHGGVTLAEARIAVTSDNQWSSTILTVEDSVVQDVLIANDNLFGATFGGPLATHVVATNSLLFGVSMRGPNWTNLDGDAPGSTTLMADDTILVSCVISPGAQAELWDCQSSAPSPSTVVGGTVTMINCTVSANDGVNVCPLGGFDVPCSTVVGGRGAHAVQVDTFYDGGGNTITGGDPAEWTSTVDGLCTYPPGQAVVANQIIDLSGQRHLDVSVGNDPIRHWAYSFPGGVFRLHGSGSSIGYLYGSFGRGPVLDYPLHGVGFLPPNEAILVGPFLSPFQLSFAFPPSPAWSGQTLGVQLYDWVDGLSVPVFVFVQ